MSTHHATDRQQAALDVLIITAVKEELDAVLKVDTGACPGSEWEERLGAARLHIAFRTFIARDGRPIQVGVTQTLEMGGIAAANVAAALVSEYRPQCLAMCGVCAGRRGRVELGDVIIADRIWKYDSGKQIVERDEAGHEVERFEADVLTYNFDPVWLQYARRFRIQDEPWLAHRPRTYERQAHWLLECLSRGEQPLSRSDLALYCAEYPDVLKRLWKIGWLTSGELALTSAGESELRRLRALHGSKVPSPEGFRVHVGPIATGDAVMQDRNVFPRLAATIRGVLGLEMEAAAVGAIARLHDVPFTIVMKGVMDFADGEKNDHFKAFAARASAECLLAFVRMHLPPASSPPSVDKSRGGEQGTGRLHRRTMRRDGLQRSKWASFGKVLGLAAAVVTGDGCSHGWPGSSRFARSFTFPPDQAGVLLTVDGDDVSDDTIKRFGLALANEIDEWRARFLQDCGEERPRCAARLPNVTILPVSKPTPDLLLSTGALIGLRGFLKTRGGSSARFEEATSPLINVDVSVNVRAAGQAVTRSHFLAEAQRISFSRRSASRNFMNYAVRKVSFDLTTINVLLGAPVSENEKRLPVHHYPMDGMQMSISQGRVPLQVQDLNLSLYPELLPRGLSASDDVARIQSAHFGSLTVAETAAQIASILKFQYLVSSSIQSAVADRPAASETNPDSPFQLSGCERILMPSAAPSPFTPASGPGMVLARRFCMELFMWASARIAQGLLQPSHSLRSLGIDKSNAQDDLLLAHFLLAPTIDEGTTACPDCYEVLAKLMYAADHIEDAIRYLDRGMSTASGEERVRLLHLGIKYRMAFLERPDFGSDGGKKFAYQPKRFSKRTVAGANNAVARILSDIEALRGLGFSTLADFELGRLYLTTGGEADAAEAEAAFRRVLGARPRHALSRFLLAKTLLSRDGATDEVVALLYALLVDLIEAGGELDSSLHSLGVGDRVFHSVEASYVVHDYLGVLLLRCEDPSAFRGMLRRLLSSKVIHDLTYIKHVLASTAFDNYYVVFPDTVLVDNRERDQSYRKACPNYQEIQANVSQDVPIDPEMEPRFAKLDIELNAGEPDASAACASIESMGELHCAYQTPVLDWTDATGIVVRPYQSGSEVILAPALAVARTAPPRKRFAWCDFRSSGHLHDVTIRRSGAGWRTEDGPAEIGVLENCALEEMPRSARTHITVVPSDEIDLQCAAGETVGTLHCAFASTSEPWMADPENDDTRLLRPYTALDGTRLLAAGFWSEVARDGGLPPWRVEVGCKYTVTGRLADVAFRWRRGDAWSAGGPWYAGTVSDCDVDYLARAGRIEIQLKRQDRDGLACASPRAVDGLRCAFETPGGLAAGTQRALLQPYKTHGRGNQTLLATGVWAQDALKGHLPEKPFSVECDWTPAGTLANVSVRWSKDGRWHHQSGLLNVGVVSRCTLRAR